jgi:hypothetical protein
MVCLGSICINTLHKGDNDDDDDNNNNKFNQYLLTYRLKNTSACYKVSTKTQRNTNTVQYTKTKHKKPYETIYQ